MARVPFLSDEWFAAVAEAADVLDRRPGLDLVVQQEVAEIPGVKGIEDHLGVDLPT